VLRPERAAADLFGYQKGAFTGATADHPGHFRAAAGGTVFFDEIGLTSLDVQAMLLRVVEDRIVQPLTLVFLRTRCGLGLLELN